MTCKIVNGSISFGSKTVIEENYFELKEKEKIAIVGRNENIIENGNLGTIAKKGRK